MSVRRGRSESEMKIKGGETKHATIYKKINI